MTSTRLTGIGALVHIIGNSKAALAIGGVLSSIGAIAALLLGVLLHG